MKNAMQLNPSLLSKLRNCLERIYHITAFVNCRELLMAVKNGKGVCINPPLYHHCIIFFFRKTKSRAAHIAAIAAPIPIVFFIMIRLSQQLSH